MKRRPSSRAIRACLVVALFLLCSHLGSCGSGQSSADGDSDRSANRESHQQHQVGSTDQGTQNVEPIADAEVIIHPIERIETHAVPRRVRGELLVRVTYPASEGVFPVIVFSHGALGSKDGYDPLIDFWASRGFVCLQPTHGDSLSLMSDEQRNNYRTALDALRDPQIMRHWSTRPSDVSMAIDVLGEIEAAIPQEGCQLDRERIAVAGHSFGAHTAQLIGGMTIINARGQRMNMYDSRAKAIIAISPQGEGLMLDARSWSSLMQPTLMITGTNDHSPLHADQDPAWRLDAFRHAPPGDRYLLYIDDAHHGFGGIAGGVRFASSGPERPAEVELIQHVTLDFLRAFVLEDEAALARINRGQMQEVEGVTARLSRKDE